MEALKDMHLQLMCPSFQMISIQEQTEIMFHNDFVILQPLLMLIYMQSTFLVISEMHAIVSTAIFHTLLGRK